MDPTEAIPDLRLRSLHHLQLLPSSHTSTRPARITFLEELEKLRTTHSSTSSVTSSARARFTFLSRNLTHYFATTLNVRNRNLAAAQSRPKQFWQRRYLTSTSSPTEILEKLRYIHRNGRTRASEDRCRLPQLATSHGSVNLDLGRASGGPRSASVRTNKHFTVRVPHHRGHHSQEEMGHGPAPLSACRAVSSRADVLCPMGSKRYPPSAPTTRTSAATAASTSATTALNTQ